MLPAAVPVAPAFRPRSANDPRNIIFKKTLAVYEDSIQPTGTIHWHNDGPWGSPNPHTEMKKLVHELVLTVEGPNQNQINNCVDQAFTVGIIAGIAAAFASGWAAAADAAMSGALASLSACLGATYTEKVDDLSHWVFWDT
jgi:hypothetical protein